MFGFKSETTFPESEYTVANRVIKKLEDRRVLIDPPVREDINSCTNSIIQIRSMLSKELIELKGDGKLVSGLQAMRSACRKYLNDIESSDIPTSYQINNLPPEYASKFHIILGKLISTLGLNIGLIAGQYKIDVHEDLAKTLPDERED